ncbi:large ribosomal subunit protein P1A [Trichomonascus vanleenenianus]|uniref:60S acidic ribosomal protein P1 n=1 Tax=Trichomonascus vanleenenianus TaxID=2268995 RepID=UPI003ECA273F
MSEQAVAYAALILADADIEITSDKLQALVKAAGVTEVEPIWTDIFAKAINNQNIHELLTQISVASGPAAVGGASAAAGGEAAAEEEAAEEEKEESDEDMGMGLFD